MMFPPSILRMKIKESEGKGINLWLPIFLLWPLIPLVILIGFAVLAVYSICSRKAESRSILLTGYYIWVLICSLRGLMVKVKDNENDVNIEFH
ncbi:MAG: hypothetical protein ACYC27_02740 [Armatimonadota bacterium]